MTKKALVKESKKILRLKIRESFYHHYTEQMRQALSLSESDYEVAHGDADTILCNLLNELGLKNIVKIFKNVSKRYA